MENDEMLVKTQNELEQARKERKRLKNTILAIIIIIILLIGLTITIFLARSNVTFFGQAKGNNTTKVELANSYMFASPLKAKANGNEKIRVTVFVLDTTGRGVFGKTVNLKEISGLLIDNVQTTTDDLGRAIFDISSRSANYYVIESSVEGKAIPQRVNISFE